ncbi:MAG: sodium:calcium antiporter [Candidatus Paceibacterota bacterium]|jgi:cation:H+ antiporter
MIPYILLFLLSCGIFFVSGQWLLNAIVRMATYLGWREFVIAFIVVAIATSLPNLFVGITSALQGIPELSFGDVLGGNLFDLTVAVAVAALFAKGLPADSKMVQTSAMFTMMVALAPLFLILDGTLGRGDGMVLIMFFLTYMIWLFSKKERFCKTYEGERKSILKDFKNFLKDMGRIISGLVFLLIAAQGIVLSAKYFSMACGLPIGLVGILIVGVGSALPEAYFATIAARKVQTWMTLGNIMGSVIIVGSLVLGIVALINPIEITDFSPYAIARFFVVLAAIFFFSFVRTGRKIVVKEALFLLFLYVFFVFLEIIAQ